MCLCVPRPPHSQHSEELQEARYVCLSTYSTKETFISHLLCPRYEIVWLSTQRHSTQCSHSEVFLKSTIRDKHNPLEGMTWLATGRHDIFSPCSGLRTAGANLLVLNWDEMLWGHFSSLLFDVRHVVSELNPDNKQSCLHQWVEGTGRYFLCGLADF